LQGVKEEALDFEGIQLEAGSGLKERGVIVSKATAKNFDISDLKGILGKNLILEVISLPSEEEPTISSLSGLKQTKIEATISGIASDELVSAIYLPLDKLKGVLGKNAYDGLKVKVSDRKKVAAVRSEIEKMGYSTSAVLDLIEQIDRVFLITQIVLGTIGGVALMVALLGIINTMMISLLERTHEIGIMKAIGASNREIRRIFAYESGLFGLFGGIFGVSAAFLLGQGVNNILNYLIRVSGGTGSMVIFITPKSFAFEMIILSVLVSLLAGWWPARRAAKLSAMEALRYE